MANNKKDTKKLLGYQVEYDALFLTKNPHKLKWVKPLQNPYYDKDKGMFIEHHDKEIYKNYPVDGLDLMIACKIYKDGKQFLAHEKDAEDIDFPEKDRNFGYLNDLYAACVNTEKSKTSSSLPYPFELKFTDKAWELIHKGYTIQLEITEWWVDFEVKNGLAEPYKISEDQWLNYFTDHFDEFNNSDNYVAQSTSFGTRAVYEK